VADSSKLRGVVRKVSVVALSLGEILEPKTARQKGKDQPRGRRRKGEQPSGTGADGGGMLDTFELRRLVNHIDTDVLATFR